MSVFESSWKSAIFATTTVTFLGLETMPSSSSSSCEDMSVGWKGGSSSSVSALLLIRSTIWLKVS